MRISLRSQYSNFLFNLQNTQSRLMDLNVQASSQKRINKPSDDPVGTGRVMNYRNSIAAIDQYKQNIDTAKGWLNLADEAMMQASTILTKLKGLAEQGATGTMTASDREASSYEVRQLFGQLMNLANTKYEGNSIFGGHKFEGSAYQEALMVYDQDGKSVDAGGLPIASSITGASGRSVVVQFLDPAGGTGSATVGVDQISYRYSKDGGTTWTNGTLDSTVSRTLDLDGVDVTLRDGYTVNLSPSTNTKTSQGSWLTIAPTAVYQGDHEMQAAVTFAAQNPPISVLPLGGFEKDLDVSVPSGVTFGNNVPFTVDITSGGSTWSVTVPNTSNSPIIDTPYGGIRLSGVGTGAAAVDFTVHAGQTGVQNLGSDVNARAQGIFSGDVMVRIDYPQPPEAPLANAPLTIGSLDADEQVIRYSYSTDGGVNWSTGHKASNSGDPAVPVELLVPGGKLVLSSRGTSSELAENALFAIHPQTATHNVEISAGDYVQVNNIGASVFGGHFANGTVPIFSETSEEKNILVNVGKLVAALENNDQQGCAQALESLKVGHEYFTTQLASVGARENRLTVAGTVLSGLKLNETERMSNIEDVDLATLMTELANQQLSYEAVLKSSSMIMRMSLVNYL